MKPCVFYWFACIFKKVQQLWRNSDLEQSQRSQAVSNDAKGHEKVTNNYVGT